MADSNNHSLIPLQNLSSDTFEMDDNVAKINQIDGARRQVNSAHDGIDIVVASKITTKNKLNLEFNNQAFKLVDTHAHIHDPEFKFEDPEMVIKDAKVAGVSTILVVGTSVDDSFLAAEFALAHDNVYAIIGSHPHNAKKDLPELYRLEKILKDTELEPKIVGIGETGLDYYYNNSPRGEQMKSLELQLSLAKKYNLPCSFHVREAFDDFWSVYNKFNTRGVLHSYTDNLANMKKGLNAGLYFGINGISTFTKNERQLEMFNSIPLDRVVLETDAPFLTPVPHRGKMNVSAYVKLIAEDISNKRSLTLAEVAKATTDNAYFLFNLPR